MIKQLVCLKLIFWIWVVIPTISFGSTEAGICVECKTGQQSSTKIVKAFEKFGAEIEKEILISAKKKVSFQNGKIITVTSKSSSYLYLFDKIPCQKGQPSCSEELDFIKLFKRSLDSIPKNQDILLILNLDGGDLDTTYKLIDILEIETKKGRRIKTYVPPGGVCTSACIPLFTSIEERWSAASSRFGFHQCTTEDGPSESATKTYLGILESHGVQSSWLESKFPKGSGSLIVNPSQLADSNIAPNIDNHMIPTKIAFELTRLQNRTPTWGNPFSSEQ